MIGGIAMPYSGHVRCGIPYRFLGALRPHCFSENPLKMSFHPLDIAIFSVNL